MIVNDSKIMPFPKNSTYHIKETFPGLFSKLRNLET